MSRPWFMWMLVLLTILIPTRTNAWRPQLQLRPIGNRGQLLDLLQSSKDDVTSNVPHQNRVSLSRNNNDNDAVWKALLEMPRGGSLQEGEEDSDHDNNNNNNNNNNNDDEDAFLDDMVEKIIALSSGDESDQDDDDDGEEEDDDLVQEESASESNLDANIDIDMGVDIDIDIDINNDEEEAQSSDEIEHETVVGDLEEVLEQESEYSYSSSSSSASSSSEEEDQLFELERGGKEEEEDLRQLALDLRTQGKDFHDAGDWESAARTFRTAASHLDNSLLFATEPDIQEEAATCRLHEALCRLKLGDFSGCVTACTEVLDDGIQIIPLVESQAATDTDADADANADIESSSDEEQEKGNHTHMVVRLTTPSTTLTSGTSDTSPSSTSTMTRVSGAVRARAYHRRAKARLALGDTEGALEDAKAASFLGDQKAVALYGRLMRDGNAGAGGASQISGLPSSSSHGTIFPTQIQQQHQEPTSPLLTELMSGRNPFLPTAPGASSSSGGLDALLLNSILGKSKGSSSSSGGSGGLGLGLLGDLMGNKKKGKNDNPSSLAKSVLSNLSKRMEDKETQETLCRVLHSTDAAQLKSYGTMAGMTLTDKQCERIVAFAQRVTPKNIDRTLTWVKRGLAVLAVLRKTLKVISKYKHLIVLIFLVGWIKSAILRPLPINKKTAKLAAAAAAAAAQPLPQAASFLIF